MGQPSQGLQPHIWLCLGLVTVPHSSCSILHLNLGQGPQPPHLSMQPQLQPADSMHPVGLPCIFSRTGAP